jgi:hypothetical protein
MWNLLGEDLSDYREKCAQDAITPYSDALIEARRRREVRRLGQEVGHRQVLVRQ